MKDIPIEQMDERRLRVELSSALAVNQLLNTKIEKLEEENKKLEEVERLRKACRFVLSELQALRGK